MPHLEGTSIAHKAGDQRFVATLAGVDLDRRLCLAVAAAVILALVGGSQLELLVAALALFRTVWTQSRTASPTPRARGSHSPWAGDAAAVVDDARRPNLPQVRGRDLRPSSISPAANIRARYLRPRNTALAANQPACQKHFELIMEHVHAKKWAKAFDVLTEMRQLSIEPNVVCYTALITACDKTNQPKKALELLDTMLMEGVEPDVVAYNAVITACSNGQMPESAEEKCAEMQERGLTPNVVTYTSLIRAWGQSRHPQRVWEVFNAMKEAGEKPNVITFSSLIQAADRCQDPEKGLRIYIEMEEDGIEPSSFAYDNLSKCWRHLPRSRAVSAIRMLQIEGTPPSKSACSAVISKTRVGPQLPRMFDN